MKFAVLADWPDVKNAEYEVIKRIQFAAKRIGHECIIIDPQGRIIKLHNNGHKQIGIRVCDDDDVAFVLNLHFASPKIFDKFTFSTTWNPPQFFYDWGYTQASRNFSTSDDYLTYQSRPIIAHLQNLLLSSRKDISEAMQMVPSVPAVEAPDFHTLDTDNAKVFYSGINWERLANKNGRHHELFQLLDKKGFMRIHGPELFLGQKPWAGFKSFCGEIPFDGVSTIKVIQECGISLVLSSDVHRDSHAATNRLYESLEAGAIIISDDNKFVMDNFGDVVLPITYTNNHTETCSQVVKHVNWINSNKEEAKVMAKKAHNRYRKMFGLEQQLSYIVNNFEQRKNTVHNKCQIKELDGRSVTVIVDTINRLNSEFLEETLTSLNKQELTGFNVIIICLKNDRNTIEELCGHSYNFDHSIIELDLSWLGSTVNNQPIIPKGRILEQVAKDVELDMVIMMNCGDVFFRNHLSTLVFPIICEKATISISGWIIENKESNREIGYFGEAISCGTFLSLAHRSKESSVLFCYKPEFTTWYLDELLPCLYLADAALEKRIAFTNSPTVIVKEYTNDDITHYDEEKQVQTVLDSIRFNPKFIENTGSGASTNVVLTDDLFVRTQKRILWNFFSGLPRFQRFCQKTFRLIKGVAK